MHINVPWGYIHACVCVSVCTHSFPTSALPSETTPPSLLKTPSYNCLLSGELVLSPIPSLPSLSIPIPVMEALSGKVSKDNI